MGRFTFCPCPCVFVLNVSLYNIQNADSSETPKTIESLDFPYGFGNVFCLSIFIYFLISHFYVHGCPLSNTRLLIIHFDIMTTSFILWLFFAAIYINININIHMYKMIRTVCSTLCTAIEYRVIYVQNTCQYIDGSKHKSLFKFTSDEPKPLRYWFIKLVEWNFANSVLRIQFYVVLYCHCCDFYWWCWYFHFLSIRPLGKIFNEIESRLRKDTIFIHKDCSRIFQMKKKKKRINTNKFTNSFIFHAIQIAWAQQWRMRSIFLVDSFWVSLRMSERLSEQTQVVEIHFT